MNEQEREALGRAIARVIDQRMLEMRERVSAMESQLADVPAAIERCAPAEMLESLRATVLQFDSRNAEALERAHDGTASLGVRVEEFSTRLDDATASIETQARGIALEVLNDALRMQGQQAAEAIEKIKDQALAAW